MFQTSQHIMDTHFKHWNKAHYINQLIATPVCKYVVLLTQTKNFNAEIDLKKTLGITKRPVYWIILKFRELGIQVEYGTIFSQGDIKDFGPVSKIVSEGIVRYYLQTKYPASTIFVCPAGYAKQLPFQSINPQTLCQRLIGQRNKKSLA